MYNKVAYSKEGKQILDIFDQMTPWDRVELMDYIANNKMSSEEYYNAFIQHTQYDNTEEGEVDVIAEVTNQGLEGDALDAIGIDRIADYVCDNEMIGDVLEKEDDGEAIAKALKDLSGPKLYSVLCKLSIMTSKVEIGKLELKKYD